MRKFGCVNYAHFPKSGHISVNVARYIVIGRNHTIINKCKYSFYPLNNKSDLCIHNNYDYVLPSKIPVATM